MLLLDQMAAIRHYPIAQYWQLEHKHTGTLLHIHSISEKRGEKEEQAPATSVGPTTSSSCDPADDVIIVAIQRVPAGVFNRSLLIRQPLKARIVPRVRLKTMADKLCKHSGRVFDQINSGTI